MGGKPQAWPCPSGQSKIKRIPAGIFQQGALPGHQHPLPVELREELHGAVRENDLVWLHLWGQPRERTAGGTTAEGGEGERLLSGREK